MTALSYVMEAPGIFSTRLYDDARCASILAYVNAIDKWEPAKVLVGSGDGDEHLRIATAPDTRFAYTIPSTHAADVYQEFENKVGTIVQPLVRRVWGVDLPECSGTQMVRYPEGGHFRAHNDVAPDDPVTRYFAVLCYLNSNCEGGRTFFPELHYSAMPLAGKVLVFPARYFHCAEPVIRGEKFVFVTWLCGPLPVRWI